METSANWQISAQHIRISAVAGTVGEVQRISTARIETLGWRRGAMKSTRPASESQTMTMWLERPTVACASHESIAASSGRRPTVLATACCERSPRSA
eukprot:4990655-Prymnesium_polylepis.1